MYTTYQANHLPPSNGNNPRFKLIMVQALPASLLVLCQTNGAGLACLTLKNGAGKACLTLDKQWMQLALAQAKLAQQQNEVPVGAVLTQNDQLITQAHNRPISTNDPTAHAEIQLLRNAGQALQNYRFPNTTLYVTLEPCTMCLGAIIHARIARVVFAAYDQKTGACGSCQNLTNSPCFNHTVDILGGVLANQSKSLLQQFFKQRR